MKNKVLYPYVILELILFIGSYIVIVNPEISFNYRILTVIGFGLNIIFSFLMNAKSKEDRIYAVIFSSVAFLSELIYVIINRTDISLLTFLLGFIVVSSRLYKLVENDKIKKAAAIVLLATAFLLLIPVFLKALSFNYYLFTELVIVSLMNILLMIERYRNGNINHKPGWFFGASGFGFYILYLVCNTFGPLMDDTAMLKSIITFGGAIFLIPSVLMILLSFMLFEQPEA